MSDSNTPRNPGDETTETSTSPEVSTTMAVSSVEAIGQEATDIPVNLPATGTTQSISAQAGQRLQLNFDATQAAATVDGQNLILSFDIDQDGTPESSIVFENLAGDFADGDAPVLIIDGNEVAADQLINLVLAQAGELPLETAAGAGAGPTGGGGSTYDDNLGSTIDLLNAQGVLDPTELEFGLLEGIDDVTDPANGTFNVTFITTTTDVSGNELGGISGSFAGGFEDWLPNQNLPGGDQYKDDDPFVGGEGGEGGEEPVLEFAAAPMQVIFTFVPEDNETLDSVTMEALPDGARLFIGGSDLSDEYTGTFPVTLSPEDLGDVYILPPPDSDEDIIVSGTAAITDPDSGLTAVLPYSAEAIIDAVADMPLLSLGRDDGGEHDYPDILVKDQISDLPDDTENEVFLDGGKNGLISEESVIKLPINAELCDKDGSETLTLVLSGVPAGFTINEECTKLPEGWEIFGPITPDTVPDDGGEGGEETLLEAENSGEFVQYIIRYTGDLPDSDDPDLDASETMDFTTFGGLVAFNTNDYTTTGVDVQGGEGGEVPVLAALTDGLSYPKPDTEDGGRYVDGPTHTNGPVVITVQAIAEEQETDIGTDELTLDNNTAFAESSFIFDIQEDIPEIDTKIAISIDETDGDQTNAESRVTNDVTGVSEAQSHLATVMGNDGIKLPDSISQGFRPIKDGLNLFTDGSNDEADGSDGPVDTDSPSNPSLSPPDDLEDIRFVDYYGQYSGIDTTDGSAIYLYSSSSDPSVVYGRTSGISGDLAFVVTIGSDLLNDENDIDIYIEQYEALEHPDTKDHDETITFNLKYYAVDDEGDQSEIGRLKIKVDDDGPTVEIKHERGAMLVLDESVGDGGEGDPNAADETHPNADPDAIGYAEISGINLFDLSVDPGADGEKTRVFKLKLNAGPSGLVDTESGDLVVLSKDGADIVGMAGGEVVFRISVNPTTGDVDVNQYRALLHDDPSDHDESSSPEIMNAGLVKLTVKVTDGDDDTDRDSMELGKFIKFEDDGPTVDIDIAKGAMLVLDESLGGEGNEGGEPGINIVGFGVDPNAGDENHPNADGDAIGYAEITGGSLFNITVDPGTDGEDTREFTLELMAGPSGLTDTESGELVVLSMDGDDVIGMAGTNEVFRITVDEDTGDVTVNQYRALVHDDVNDHDEFSSPEIMNSNLLKLTATITDGDDDTASDSIDLGSVIKFEDDGPKIKHIRNNDDDLEEWDLTSGDHKDVVHGIVHADFGTDGGKFTSVAFDNVTDIDGTGGDTIPPGFSGSLTSGGVPVVFGPSAVIGSTITLLGKAGSDDIIKFEMDENTGSYKITLLGPIDHPDQNGNQQIGWRDQLRLHFEATATDGDGDTSIANVTVRVKDDGPNVHREWAGHLQEDDLHQNGSEMVTGYINGDFGGDGPGSTQITELLYVRDPEHHDGTPYPDFTSGGEPITFGSPTLIGGMMVLTGSANTGPGGSPETIITLSVDPITKYYEIELHKAVDHPDEDRLGYGDELEPYFRIAITDADGDVATAKLHFHITDDGPVISGKEYIMVDETDLDPGGSITASGQFDVFDYGADGPKEDNPATRPDEALCIVLNTDGLTTSEDDLPVTTSQVGNVLTGWAGGEVVFTFTVDPDGSYEYEQFIALEHPNPNNHDEPLGLSFGVKIVDGDMDRDWGSVNVTVKDDGPRLDLTNERGAMLVLDESVGFDVSDPNADDETHHLADPDAIGFAAIRGDSFFDIFVDAGADGEKSRVFSLSLARGPSGLTDTLSGDPVVLIPDGGDIVGMADGSEVFRISVDPDTGAVFVNQYRALVHDNPADHDESATPEIMSAGLVGLTATITDGDNDTASDTIELGNRIKFEDDGPTVVITHETNSMLVLDETHGSGVPGDVNAPDETHPDAHPDAIGYSAIDGDDLFMVDVDPGTDGLQSQVYSLTLMGGPSGLADSMNGLDVVLSMDGGDIVGMAGGDEVFRISVDPVTGGVEVNQFRALEHNDQTDPDEASSPEIMQSGRVKLTVTVTDGDDDSASSSMELGRLIKFEDDGPQAADDKEFVDESDSVDQPQNIGIVMDFSGSVTDPDLATEIASVKTFVETLFLSGATVSVTLVAFGADAATIGTFTDFASAEAALDGTSRGIVNSGATNFEAAMEELFSDAGGDFANIPGSNNEVFFLSDGNRNAGDEPLSDVDIVLDDGGKADLIDGDIGFTAIGIGGSISPSTFVDFFDGGVVDNVGEVISSATFEDLADILVGTIGLGSSVTGNVVTNDDAGTDGLDRICSVDVDGETFSVDEFGVLSGPTTGTPSASYDDGSKLLTVTTDKGVLEIYLDDAGGDAAGDYTYTASAAVPHGAPGSPTDDVVEDVFTYAIVDNDGDKALADLKICIHDGEPEAVDDKVVTIADTASVPQNIGVVMDFSGSVSNGDLATEIAGVKTFVQTLFGSGASVSVTLVAFGATAATLGTFTDLASAEAALDGTSRGIISSGATNFEAAMEELFANGAGNGDFDHIPGSNNEIFFLSDGNRNSGASALSSGSVVLADGGKADLLSGDIELTAIGIGGSISPSTFVSFFDGGVVPNTGEVLLATDFEALAETLLSTISLGATASGNVLTNDDAGPDGFGAPVAITEVEHDGVVHTDASDGSADGFIEFTTADGGTFSINTETGAYEYVSGVVDSDFEETFTYTMVDGDGDPSSADLEICVKAPEPIVAHDDVVLTNITFGDIDIPDTALLYNDETNPSTSLTDADNPVNGTVNDGVNIVTFTPDSLPISSLGFGSGTVVQDIAERLFGSDGYVYHNPSGSDHIDGSERNSDRDTSGSNQSTQLGRSNWVRDGSTPPNEVVHLLNINGRIKDASDRDGFSTTRRYDRDSYQIALLNGETFSLESFTGDSNLKVVLYSPGGSVLDSDFNPGELYTAPSSGNYYIRVESTDSKNGSSSRSRDYEAELSIESTDIVSPENGAFDYTISDSITSDVANVSVEYQDGSTITGTNAGEILVGGDGDDILIAGGGNDTLIGGAGSDTLTGDSGADTFLFYGQNVGIDVDTVTDYDQSEGDILDVSDLITFTDATGDVVADFVRATDTGSGTSLEVSSDGVTYTEVAVLEGVVATDILTVILDDAEVLVTVL